MRQQIKVATHRGASLLRALDSEAKLSAQQFDQPFTRHCDVHGPTIPLPGQTMGSRSAGPGPVLCVPDVDASRLVAMGAGAPSPPEKTKGPSRGPGPVRRALPRREDATAEV